MSQTKAQLLDGKASSIQFNTGSASSPTISFTGDTNTGIYSPGADQVAISTNGTGRLFVNSAGNVGIGTSTAPSANGLGLAIYDATFPRLTFRNSTTGDGTGDGTQLVQDGLNFNFANTESGSIKFFTANTERAVIDSSGRLGLGTSSPAAGLSLETFGTQLESATNGYYMPSGRMYSLLGRVTSGTDSWVGFIAPYGNSSGSCNILLQPQFNNTSQQAGTYIGGEADSANTSVLTFGHMVASSSLTGTSTKLERVRIDNAGRVGIGTTSVTGKLEISSATAYSPGNAFNDGCVLVGNSNSKLAFSYDSTNEANITALEPSVAWRRLTLNAGDTVIKTTGNEAARFSGGKLLVGTSTSTNNIAFNQKLAVVSTGNDIGGASFTTYGGTTNFNSTLLYLNRSRGTSDGSMTAVANGDIIGSIIFRGSNGSSFLDCASIASEIDGTVSGGGANDMPGRLVFSTTADGASSPTERMRIDSVGTVTTGSLGGTNVSMSPGSDVPRLEFYNGGTQNLTLAYRGASAPGTTNLAELRVLANSPLVFSTNNTERARITNDGELLVGGTNDNGAYNIQCNGTGVWAFGAYVNGSDERLKENIHPLPASLDVIKALNPVAFQYKRKFTADASVQPGFIAQELQVALAGQDYLEGVVQTGSQYLSVAYQSLIPVLTKALQEAVAKIETLEAKVAALEAQ
jgi:hypothetical protein